MGVELMKKEAIEHFDFEGTLKESDVFGCGHINDTFLHEPRITLYTLATLALDDHEFNCVTC